MQDTGAAGQAEQTPQPVSHRIVTVPNMLSTARLVGVPIFLVLILQRHDLWALLVLVLSGVTDYLDGKIARAYGLVSRLGQLLDPTADRLYILSTLLGLAWRHIIPWWLVALLVLREVFVLALGPILQIHHLPIPPVHFIGKAATFNLIYAFPLVLLGQQHGVVGTVALPIGWAFVWWGTGLYWVAGVMYAEHVRQMVRNRPGRTRAPVDAR
ncbi:CDP-alcohol phosphatidyltransferase family protein [Allobranchiibius sp. GilTou73]|uniref:CDP-alcohol phosphatidyltransferase family protein n=1 Tax=Allobranchiibius sp. GilTou73 TaxID=2904523 RepID=UPI001F439BCB|nr:CDP-alcohol phosphatidyltransferase family protein [Allobranchiibius sp. GilTou73]UIJ34044.1 CDP-alcohol phosphatidyltransferase family protein [Allobranchiibius sp. GilTou73]